MFWIREYFWNIVSSTQLSCAYQTRISLERILNDGKLFYDIHKRHINRLFFASLATDSKKLSLVFSKNDMFIFDRGITPRNLGIWYWTKYIAEVPDGPDSSFHLSWMIADYIS